MKRIGKDTKSRNSTDNPPNLIEDSSLPRLANGDFEDSTKLINYKSYNTVSPDIIEYIHIDM